MSFEIDTIVLSYTWNCIDLFHKILCGKLFKFVFFFFFFNSIEYKTVSLFTNANFRIWFNVMLLAYPFYLNELYFGLAVISYSNEVDIAELEQ